MGWRPRGGERGHNRWGAQGIGAIAPERGVAALERAIEHDRPQIAILPIDWAAFLSSRGDAVPALLRTLAEQAGTPRRVDARVDDKSRVLEELAAASPEERDDLALSHIRKRVAGVLGIPAASLRNDRGLTEMGMDSLMSVELSNRLGSDLGRPLPATLAFDRPTITALAQFLVSQAAVEDVVSEAAQPSPTQPGQPGKNVVKPEPQNGDLAGLSPDELERLLSAELNRAGY